MELQGAPQELPRSSHRSFQGAPESFQGAPRSRALGALVAGALLGTASGGPPGLKKVCLLRWQIASPGPLPNRQLQ